MSKCDFIAVEGDVVAICTVYMFVAPGEEYASGWGAYGDVDHEVGQDRAFACQGVDVGRFDECSAIRAQCPATLFVGVNDEEIWGVWHLLLLIVALTMGRRFLLTSCSFLSQVLLQGRGDRQRCFGVDRGLLRCRGGLFLRFQAFA